MYFFQSNDLFKFSIDCFPDNTVGSFAELLNDLELLEDMMLDLFGHQIIL